MVCYVLTKVVVKRGRGVNIYIGKNYTHTSTLSNAMPFGKDEACEKCQVFDCGWKPVLVDIPFRGLDDYQY